MYLVDYHTHPYSHGEKEIKYNKKLIKNYINIAYKKGIKELGFSDHDEYIKKIKLNLIDELSENSPVKLLKGIEFDYIPGKESYINRKIKKLNLDYAIGSVHFIDGWGFDNPNNIDEYQKRDIDRSYEEYYSIIEKCIESDLFNIVGHLDLIKVFGFKVNNEKKISNIIISILKKIKKYDLVLELNTNGLNKPIKEIYPSEKIIHEAYNLNIPFTLASDAHRAERVGEGIKDYTELLKRIGYKEIAVFENRKISFIEI
ncbi:MAG: histidinol-phosphatase HisJ family protein [bacterium]